MCVPAVWSCLTWLGRKVFPIGFRSTRFTASLLSGLLASLRTIMATTTPEVLPPITAAPKRNPFFKISGVGTGIVAGVGRHRLFKFAAPLLVLLKTGGTMLIMHLGLQPGCLGLAVCRCQFVFLIFVHEMGHVIAAKWLGMPVSAPIFIPFIGASIIMKQNRRMRCLDQSAHGLCNGPLAGCTRIGWICWYLVALLSG